MLDGPKATYKASIPIATRDDGRKAVDLLKDRGVSDNPDMIQIVHTARLEQDSVDPTGTSCSGGKLTLFAELLLGSRLDVQVWLPFHGAD